MSSRSLLPRRLLTAPTCRSVIPSPPVRVGLLDGQLVANPTVAEQKTSKLNIVVAGTADGIVMVESGAFEVSEEKVVEALEFGHAQVKKIVAGIKQLHDQIKPKKVVVAPFRSIRASMTA